MKSTKLSLDKLHSIAVDDFVLGPGMCQSPSDCDFNSDLCGYTHDLSATSKWLLGYGRVANSLLLPFTNPPRDSDDSFEGMYLYTDFTDILNFQLTTVRMIGPVLASAKGIAIKLTLNPF